MLKEGAFLTICTAVSLRGYEGFYLDLAALRRFSDVGDLDTEVPARLNRSTVLTEEQCARLPHIVLTFLG